MNLRLIAIAAIGLLVLSAARADNYSSKEPFSQAGAFNPTGTVTLENVNGSVEIRTWDKNEILITGEKSARTDEELKAIELKIELSANRATIKVRLPKRDGRWFFGSTIRASVRFVLTVPATANLERIETVNAGVTIDGTRGTTHAQTVNGGIRATNLAGNTRFETVNGRIAADFSRVDTGQTLSFSTVNGAVSIKLPKDTGTTLKASVVNGRIDCTVPLTLTHSSGKRTLNGTIGHGGASLKAETVNGDIKIEAR